jgi:serine/threonine protein phosphatase PrpC
MQRNIGPALDLPARVAASPYVIGDPGRAALEVSAGLPLPPYDVADVALSAAVVDDIVIRAASIRGVMHRRNNEPRQDNFALAHVRDQNQNAAVVVVCDGVGSLDRSHEAAQIAARVIAQAITDNESPVEAFKLANEALLPVASAAEFPEALSMATTAIAVVARQVSGSWLGCAAWVGDTTLWHLSADGDWTLVSQAGSPTSEDADSFYTTSARALPARDEFLPLLVEFELPGGALFLMTDGVANALGWSTDVQTALAQWWQRPADPFTFGAQASFARKSHMDDRTVVGLWYEEVADLDKVEQSVVRECAE